MRKLIFTALLSVLSFNTLASESHSAVVVAESSIKDIYQTVLDNHAPITFTRHEIKKETLPGYDDPELKGKTFLVTSVFMVGDAYQKAYVGIYCPKDKSCETLYTQPGV